MRNPEMTFRSFVYNLILTLLMFACFVAASYIGMTAAIDHMDAEEKEPRETMRHRKGKLYDAVAGSIRVVNGEPWRYEYSDVDDKGEYDLLHRALSEKQSVKCGHCGLGGKP